MNIDWQTAAVVVVIGVAGGYLARAAWQTVARKRAGACGGCSTCPANGEGDEPEVVDVGQLSHSPPSRPRD